MLTPSKQRALQALLTSRNKGEAAEKAGITTRTLSLYLSDPEFTAAYREAVGQVIEDATREAQQCLSPAINALRDMLTDDEAIQKKGSAIRVAAARSVLEFGLRLTEFNDILKELRSLQGEE